MNPVDGFKQDLNQVTFIEKAGDIEQFGGLIIQANGPSGMALGDICDILSPNNQIMMPAQVIGFGKHKVQLMPFGHSNQIRQGYRIRARNSGLSLPCHPQVLGRVINAFGQPIDDGPMLSMTPCQNTLTPWNALSRQAIDTSFLTGIHCIDTLLPMGKGQRMGIFAGSGVGKSQLLGMMATNIEADVNIIALVGERGREVNEFIENILTTEGLKKSVVVVATADEPALMRKQAVYTATHLAQYFCQTGKSVVLMVDSMTRFAMAQREISLALGEPPTARGYTPSVFSLLPGIVEQAGRFKHGGSITAFYSVLVEGDDFNEPIADVMRSLLDGHLILTRTLAHRGHYPAIDVLQSISRLTQSLTTPQERQLITRVRKLLHCYEQSREMIDIGAYQPGNNPMLDQAVQRIESINRLLQQSDGVNNQSLQSVKQQLEKIMEGVNE